MSPKHISPTFMNFRNDFLVKSKGCLVSLCLIVSFKWWNESAIKLLWKEWWIHKSRHRAIILITFLFPQSPRRETHFAVWFRIDWFHNTHNASVLHSTVHHFWTKICILLFQSGVLWDMGQIDYEICGISLLWTFHFHTLHHVVEVSLFCITNHFFYLLWDAILCKQNNIAFHIVRWYWSIAGYLNATSWKPMTCLSNIVNTMDSDQLANGGTRSSANV